MDSRVLKSSTFEPTEYSNQYSNLVETRTRGVDFTAVVLVFSEVDIDYPEVCINNS
jgi:hypothetical protein